MLGEFSVKFRIRTKEDGFQWALVAVYGAAQTEQKPAFLADLVRICDDTLPLVVGGDFNIIRRADEKKNDNFDGRWPFMFNTIIESLNLREINLSGRKFTRDNSLPNQTFEKLDRVLTSVDWEQKFPLVTVCALQRAISDHTPLLLDSGQATHKGKSDAFSFESSWFTREGFVDMISREWNKHAGGNSSVDVWQNKIRHLRQFLRGWAKNISGVYRDEQDRLLKCIDTLDRQAETRMLDDQERALKYEAEQRVRILLREEEMKWAVRAKVRAIVQGDDNTKFFHLIANGKHRKKRIIQLEQDEGTIVGHENLKLYITNYYKRLFGATTHSFVSMDEHQTADIPQIGQADNECLSAPFLEKEVL